VGRQPEVDEPTGFGSKWIPTGWARVGFWFCTVIAIAVVVRRVIALISPPQNAPPELAALDAVFASHAGLTLAHILPSLAFVVIAPLAVFRLASRGDWVERLLFPLGAWVGLTAYAMSVWPVGGWAERSAVLVFDTLFLYSLFRAFQAKRRGELARKQEWLLRAIAVLLGIATTRPVMGIFFATSRFTHLTPNQFFGIAFWIGFSINTVVIEWWLRARNRGGELKPETERSAA
jgi:hypothetical protein